MDQKTFADFFQEIDGFPRPDWESISNWISANVSPENRYEAWDSAAEYWLKKLRQHLGGDYYLDADGEFALVSALKPTEATGILLHAASAKRSMQTILKRLPTINYEGSHVILAFAEIDNYFTYLSYFYDDGEYGYSGGVFIPNGYMHIVLPPSPIYSLHSAVTHELTHLLLRHLSLPQWLEEGMAQILEELVASHSAFTIDHETAGEHQKHWRTFGLQEFWTGRAFSHPSEKSRLAYHLSQILVRNLATDYPKSFLDFVGDAKWSDAGEAAMQKHLGMSLEECVAKFLGKGNWQPDFQKLWPQQSPSDVE